MLGLKRIDTFAEDKNVIAFELLKTDLNEQVKQAGCLETIENVYMAFSLEANAKDKWSRALETGVQTLSSNGRLEVILKKYGLTKENWLTQKHLETLQ